MGWRDIWIDRNTQRVRSGWRVLTYCVAALLCSVILFIPILAIIVRATGYTPEALMTSYWGKLAESLAVIPVFIGLGILFVRAFDRLPARTLGIMPSTSGLRMMAGGFGAGFVLVVLPLLVCWATGLARFSWNMLGVRESALLALAVGAMLLFAAEEELMFRGYIFQTLLRGIGPLATLLLTSAAFFVLHLGNPNVTSLGMANIFLAGVFLGLLYLRSGELWLPIGVHAGWNFAQLSFHVPVSGMEIPFMPPVSLTFAGPDWSRWLTGGAFGFEGGVIASVVLLGAIAFTAYTRWGLPLASYWWEWRELSVARDDTTPPPPWDIAVGTRYYQWKLSYPEKLE